MSDVFRTTRRVEFADTDLAGICHFSRYPVFLETAEHQFVESLGYSIDMPVDGERIGWPRVSLSVQYRAPAKFGDVLEISVRVKKKGRTSLTYAFTVERGGTLLATAEVVAVCCKHDSQGNIVSIPIPAGLADQIIEAQVE